MGNRVAHGGKILKLLKLAMPFDGLQDIFAFKVDGKFAFGVCAPSLETTPSIVNIECF